MECFFDWDASLEVLCGSDDTLVYEVLWHVILIGLIVWIWWNVGMQCRLLHRLGIPFWLECNFGCGGGCNDILIYEADWNVVLTGYLIWRVAGMRVRIMRAFILYGV